MSRDDLRRVNRLRACCRVDVRDRSGPWTAVTDDIGARGCRIVTTKQPRLGTLLALSVSSDLFAETLEVLAEAAWVSAERVGVRFLPGNPPPGALSPLQFVERLVDLGRIPGPEPIGTHSPRIAPAIRRPGPSQAAAPVRHQDAPTARAQTGDDGVLVLPFRSG